MPQHSIIPSPSGSLRQKSSNGVLTLAGKSLPRPVGRPILELVPVLLPKPAPEWRGFVENVAERATPRVGKLTGERKSGPRKAICAAGSTQRCISRLLRTHLHHPASLPCNRLHSPGPIFVQFVLSLLSFIYTFRLRALPDLARRSLLGQCFPSHGKKI